LGKESSESPNSTTAPSPKEADAASLCGSMIIPPLNPIYHHTAKEALYTIKDSYIFFEFIKNSMQVFTSMLFLNVVI
jgi:hypothetical protein